MKKKQTKNKSEKDLIKESYQIFSEASAFTIDQNLKKVEFDELVSGLYLPTKDEDIQYLLKKMEKQILYAKLHPQTSGVELHKFCLSTSEEIKNNGLVEKFYKLAYLVYTSLNEKRVNQEIINAYFNLTIQLNTYLSKSSKLIPYGISTKGDLMVRSEIVNNLVNINVETYHALKKGGSANSISGIYSRHGYKNITDMNGVQNLTVYDQVVSNMLFHLVYFINEENEHIVAPPYSHPNNEPTFHSVFYNPILVTMLLNRIRSREILLPAEGIKIKIEGMSSISEVFMEETIKDDNVILLYRLKMDDGYLSGFFDTRKEFFYTPWRDSTMQERIGTSLQSLILQMYLHLTCTLTESEKMELYYLDSANRGFRVEYNIKVAPATSRQIPTYRHYDRSKYLAELINIKPFLRHLPLGAEASDDARLLARRLGIDLPKGMTLVSGFKRKSWVKESKKSI